jgi:NADPH-dependent 2,4-dienoyl-CoA reductase/sulfur reductase-like enzyme
MSDSPQVHIGSGPDHTNNILAPAFGLLIVFPAIPGSFMLDHCQFQCQHDANATVNLSRLRMQVPMVMAQAHDKGSEVEVHRHQPPRIVIIGGGFAGVAAARALQRCNAEIVLIDRRNHHIFQPLLYQVATAILAPSTIATPIRQLAEKQKNLSVTMAEVTRVDLTSRSLEMISPVVGEKKIAFDYLVVATGMRPSYFGHHEFAKHAPGLKTLADAEAIRAKILSAYEAAEATDDADERARQMTFVLVGAGPTGVELAGSIGLMRYYHSALEFPADRSCENHNPADRGRSAHPAELRRTSIQKSCRAARKARRDGYDENKSGARR